MDDRVIVISYTCNVRSTPFVKDGYLDVRGLTMLVRAPVLSTKTSWRLLQRKSS